MDTLESSLEANCDRQTEGQKDKATYRGSSYRSALKYIPTSLGAFDTFPYDSPTYEGPRY